MSGSWVMAGENKGKDGGDALGVVEGGERTVLGKPKERTTVGLQTQRQVIWVSQPPTKALECPCHTSHRSATLMPSQSLMARGTNRLHEHLRLYCRLQTAQIRVIRTGGLPRARTSRSRGSFFYIYTILTAEGNYTWCSSQHLFSALPTTSIGLSGDKQL